MKFELHQNSLFAVLMRSSWWISALLAVGIFGATRMFLAAEFAVFAASPFSVITMNGDAANTANSAARNMRVAPKIPTARSALIHHDERIRTANSEFWCSSNFMAGVRPLLPL